MPIEDLTISELEFLEVAVFKRDRIETPSDNLLKPDLYAEEALELVSLNWIVAWCLDQIWSRDSGPISTSSPTRSDIWKSIVCSLFSWGFLNIHDLVCLFKNTYLKAS